MHVGDARISYLFKASFILGGCDCDCDLHCDSEKSLQQNGHRAQLNHNDFFSPCEVVHSDLHYDLWVHSISVVVFGVMTP